MKNIYIIIIALMLTAQSAYLQDKQPAVDKIITNINNYDANIHITTFKKQEVVMDIDMPFHEIRTIIKIITDVYNLKVIIPDTLCGSTSINLKNATWRLVFSSVLEPVGFTYEVGEDNVIKITKNPIYEKLEETQKELDNRKKEIEGLKNNNIIIEHDCFVELIIVILCILISPFVIIRLCLAVGLLIDKKADKTIFISKHMWAVAVLLGGFLIALIYWLIHHSSLKENDDSK